MANFRRFIRGQAGPKALSAALDELGVGQGEEFLVARFDESIEEFAATTTAAARQSDPDTSRSAAEVALTGEHIKAVFNCFVEAGSHGLAAFEVVHLTGIRDAWKRVSDLKRGAFIEEVPGVTRSNEETHREGAVFVLSDKGLRAAGQEPVPPADPPPALDVDAATSPASQYDPYS